MDTDTRSEAAEPAIKRNGVIDTGLTVWDGDVTQPVYLRIDGLFIVLRDDAGEPVTRTTFEDLTRYFEGLVARKQQKARDAAKKKVTPFEGTIFDGGSRYGGDPETATPRDITIRGMSIDGNRVLADGLDKGQRLDKYTAIYTRLFPQEVAEVKVLQASIKMAQDKLRQFLRTRAVGKASQVASAVDGGHPVTVDGSAEDED